MSGLGELGLNYSANVNALQVQQKDIDQYDVIQVDNPSVSNSWFGTMAGGTNGQTKALVQINQIPDYPRNALYSVIGTNDVGGTFTINGYDQFGVYQTEIAGFGTKAAGTPAGSVFGTVIWAKITSGSFTFASGSAGSGSAQVGFGTVSNGSAQSNWFGLMTKIGGTGDLKLMTWISSTTVTTLNAGTNLGSLVNITTHAFQGTGGVAATDHYKVWIKPTYDNTFKGTMSAL